MLRHLPVKLAIALHDGLSRTLPMQDPPCPAPSAQPTSGVYIPDPPPCPPPQLADKVNTLLGWGKWAVLVCGVAGLFICAGQMAIGRKNRSTFAADGATGVPWVLGGLSLAATAASIVSVFFN